MIYADHAATTRLSATAFEAARDFLFDEFGNASSRYSLGLRARRAVESARLRIANAIGCDADEVFFTSGGSEGNSWILSRFFNRVDLTMIVSAFEHPSVEQNAREFERRGGRVVRLPVNRSGVVSIDACEEALKSGKVGLVSIMRANNEVGTIQPIDKISALAKSYGAFMHTDAVQAVGKISVDARALNVDFLTASAHKFNGPKGVGFAYKRRGVELSTMVRGGGQERGFRSGTENVFGIVAMSFALEENVVALAESARYLNALTKRTLDVLRTELDEGDFQIAGWGAERTPGAIDVLFKHADGEALTILLDMKGVCVSTGSACDSVKKEPSRVLTALGYASEEAKSAIRVSYGRDNTLDEATEVGKALVFAYRKLRRS